MDKKERIEKIDKEVEECGPCDVAVTLGTAREICKLADKNTKNQICDVLYEEAVMGKISTEEYLRKNLAIVSKDKEAKFTMKELLNFHSK